MHYKPCGMCITATVHPDTMSQTKSFLHEYLGSQDNMGKRLVTIDLHPEVEHKRLLEILSFSNSQYP